MEKYRRKLIDYLRENPAEATGINTIMLGIEDSAASKYYGVPIIMDYWLSRPQYTKSYKHSTLSFDPNGGLF